MRGLFIRIFVFVIFILTFFAPSKIYASELIGNWSSGTHLPYFLASHVSFSAAGKPSVVGGSAATGFSHHEVITATPSADGNTSDWVVTSTTPTAPIGHAVAQVDNYIYILGGKEENAGSSMSIVDKVFLGEIDSSGKVSTWQQVNSLPQSSIEGKAVTVGDSIYFAGGSNDGGFHDEIYKSEINPDGTLAGWSQIGNLPTPMVTFGMVEYQNRIYIFGGYDGSAKSQVYSADVNPTDGSLSAWQPQSSLIQPFADKNQSILVGNKIIFAGGFDGIALTNKVFYTSINTDGTLEPWHQSSSSLPLALGAGALTYANGYLYFTGGVGQFGYMSIVYYAKVNDGLNVPLLKQTDPAWSGFTYDSANLWSPSDPTIGGWGCALTSAAMVFQYHGIKKLPDGVIDLEPGTLNVWLKGQPDGYISNGLVNWLALTRLSKQAKSVNSSFTTGDALEFLRMGGANKVQLANDLANNIPDILEEPGHFVVATGSDSATFKINDPFYSRTDLTSYSNTFLSLRRFIPSFTDLSYIMAVADPEVELSLKTASGSAIGESFSESPLDHDGGAGTSGNILKILMSPKPATGDYVLDVGSSTGKSYSIKIYLYDKDGNVSIASSSGVVGPSDTDKYTIKFNSDDSNLGSSKQDVTFESLLADLNSLCKLGDVNKVICLALAIEIKTAERLSKSRAKPAAITLLRVIDKGILIQKGRGISNNAYNILHADLQSLISSL